MNKVNQIFSTFQKGSFHTCRWFSDVKTLAAFKSEKLQKAVVVQLRVGITYDNQKEVQENRANGNAPKENAGLPWGKWESFPYQIGHKGKTYSRVYFKRCKSVFFLNGKKVAKSEIEHMLPKQSGSFPTAFTITSDKFTSIKKNGKELLAV